MRLFAKRAAEQLEELAEEFEKVMGPPESYDPDDFSKGITQEFEDTFTSE